MSTPPLESTSETIRRLEAAHPGFKIWRLPGAGKWYARRTGPLTHKERTDGPDAPLEADDAEMIGLRIKAAEGLAVP